MRELNRIFGLSRASRVKRARVRGHGLLQLCVWAMFRWLAVLRRCPFAPPALPGFTATMSSSDSHPLSTASSLVRLGPRLRSTDPKGSELGARQGMGLAGFVIIVMSRSKRSRTPGRPAALAMSALRDVVCGVMQRIDLSQQHSFGAQCPSRSASSVTLVPRVLPLPTASPTSLPSWTQGWVPGSWLGTTWGDSHSSTMTPCRPLRITGDLLPRGLAHHRANRAFVWPIRYPLGWRGHGDAEKVTRIEPRPHRVANDLVHGVLSPSITVGSRRCPPR